MRKLIIPTIFLAIFFADLGAQEGIVARKLDELSGSLVKSYLTLEQAKYRNNVAVADFVNKSPLAEQRDLGYAFSELLSAYLTKNAGTLRVVERKQLDKLLGELEFSLSDLVDPAQVLQIGKMSGANLLIIGSVFDVGNDVMIEVKLVETESATVLLSETISIPRTAFVEATQYLVEMHNAFTVNYSWMFMEDYSASRVAAMYSYFFSRGLSFSIELFGAMGHAPKEYTHETYSAWTTYWHLESTMKQLGLGLYLGAKYPRTGLLDAAWYLGPVITSYLDSTELIDVVGTTIVSSTPYEGIEFMLGVRAGLVLEFHLRRKLDLVAGGWYQYVPDNSVIKRIDYQVSPPQDDLHITFSDILKLGGASAMVGIQYNF